MSFPLAKVGKSVEITRRNGLVATGKVHDVPAQLVPNSFVTVNVGDKKKPDLVKVRPSQLRKPS